jgi:DNA (cytosine-5)-methyltransferase 1
MDKLIVNRRKKIFGAEQDCKKLTLDQIRTFYGNPNIVEITESLIKKRVNYLGLLMESLILP